MATIFIQNPTSSELTITDNSLYDIIILPAAEGIKTDGRVISVHGGSYAAGYQQLLESYALSLGKNDAVLTIGGNSIYNGEDDIYTYSYSEEYRESILSLCFTYKPVVVDRNHNLAHYAINATSTPQGAIYFSGSDAKLVLTAQNGAGNADVYNKHTDTNKPNKQDDWISIYSENFGFYVDDEYEKCGDALVVAKTAVFNTHSGTINYTIHAKNKLTVTSDLAGKITSYAAGLHVGHGVQDGDKITWSNDSDNITVRSAGVKAGNLILDANFRAEINSVNGEEAVRKNNQNNFDREYYYSKVKTPSDNTTEVISNNEIYDSEKEYFTRKVDDKGVVTYEQIADQAKFNEAITSGTAIYIYTEDYLESLKTEVTGTTIVNSVDGGSKNNTIDAYGILVDGNLSQKNDDKSEHIWAGQIDVETSNARISASKDFSHAEKGAMKTADASNNTIAAYGIKVGGTLELKNIDAIIKDDGTTKQDSIINVTTSGNLLEAISYDPEGKSAQTTLSGSVISAVGIDADKIIFGSVSENFIINSNLRNNSAILDTNTPIPMITESEVSNYGIRANTITLDHFTGKINLNTTGNYVNIKEKTIGINANGTLVSNSSMHGTIRISGDSAYNAGIWGKTITVNGALNTTINAINTRGFTAGVYSEKFTGPELSSTIHVNAGVGFNINGQLSSNIAGDAFDFSGYIFSERYGIVTNQQLNLRVSGTITVYGGSAIKTEHAYSATADNIMVSEYKYDDSVEFSRTAVVNGEVDLHIGTNQYTISSEATIVGSLKATNGAANIIFDLESQETTGAALRHTGNGNATVTVNSSDDVTLFDSHTLVVNLNYAEVGVQYNLIQYTTFDADEFWSGKKRQIAFRYQGEPQTFTIDPTSNNQTFTINTANGGSITGQVIYNTAQNMFSVIITEKTDLVPVVVKPFENNTRNEFIDSIKYDADKCTLTIDWDAFKDNKTAESYSLGNIAAYEVEYQRFDSNGDTIGESVVLRVTDSKCSILGVDNDASVKWRIRILGDSSANTVTKWSDWQNYKALNINNMSGELINNTYTIDFEEIVDSIIDPEDNLYDVNSFEKYVIEYQLYDVHGKKVGTIASVDITDINTATLDIVGINDERLIDWRVGVKDANSNVVQWSDWNKGNKFDVESFGSSVNNASLNDDYKTGVVSAVAQVSFNEIKSENAIRNYVIEYFAATELITNSDVPQDFDSLQEYIASNIDGGYFATADRVYTKTFTGTSIVLSDIQDQVYVYWRVKAIDVEGNESAWVAGNTFRVWSRKDVAKPTLDRKTVDHLSIVCARPEENDQPTNVSATIVWNKAIDTESGIRSYHITVADGSNQNVKEFTVFAEEANAYYSYSAQLDRNKVSLSTDKTYGVQIGVDDNGNAIIVRVELIDNGNNYTIKWGSADGNLSTTNIKLYEFVEYDGTEIVWSADAIHTIGSISAPTKYDYSFTFEKFNWSGYTYTVKAEDYFGNLSDAYTGSFTIDKNNPRFTTANVSVEREGNHSVGITLTPTFSWDEATDANGILRYEIKYRVKGSSTWETIVVATTEAENGKYSYTLDENLDPAEYEYQIIAYDIFNNTTTLTGKFGSSDTEGPKGYFDGNSLKATLDVEFQTETDFEEDNVFFEDDSYATDFVPVETTTNVLTKASVTFSWDGNFTDDTGVIYKIQFSDSEDFTKVYEFWTEDESITFDQTTVGRPFSLFETFESGKVYWRVQAYDTTVERNPNPTVMNGETLDFVNPITGQKLQGSSPVAPNNINAENAEGWNYIENTSVRTHKEEIVLSWETPNSITGVYYFNIYVYDEKGKLIVSGDTLELNNPNGTGHLDDLLTVETLASSSKITVSDLGKLLNYDLEDGVYKIRISAVDGAGRETFHTNNKKEYYEFRQDTTAPNVNGNTVRVNCIFPPNNDKCDVILTWDPVALEANGSGIDYYEVSIRPLVGANGGNEEDWYTEKVTDTKFQYSFANDANLRYEFKIVAVDKAGNIGKTYYSKDTQEDGYILQVDGYANELTSENLQRITLPQNDTTKFEIKNENVGGNDLADCFVINNNTSGYLDIYVKNIESIVGSSKQLTIEVFTADNLTKAFKTYTVKAGNLIATDLYLEAGNEYYFRIKEANASAVTSYYLEFTKDDKTVTFNAQGPTEETTGTLGQLNTADYVKIDVTTKGRYSFNVIGANVKFTIFKLVDGKMTSVGSVTGTAAGKTLANVILEAEGEYYYQVVPTSTKVGVDYTYTVESTFTEAFPMDDTVVEDDQFNSNDVDSNNVFNLPVVKSASTSVNGIVSCDDKSDFYKLNLEESGKFNFEITPNNDDPFTDPVKLTVYKLVDNKLVALGSVSVKAGATSAQLSKDLLLDKDYAGGYYVQVESTSKTWGSEYTITATANGIVGGDQTSNEDFEATTSIIAPGQTGSDDWVGFNDMHDYYKVDLSNNRSGLYQFALDAISENTILTVYEKDDNGNVKKLTSITVKANNDGTTSQLMLNKNKNYYVEVAAQNANVLGSYYNLTMVSPSDANDYAAQEAETEPLSIRPEVDVPVNWVGFNDISDRYEVNLDRSGEYNFELTGITENAVVTVYDADFNKLTSVTVKAGKSDTTKNLILSNDDNRPYYVEVTIANQKVLGTNYTLSMNTIGYAQGEEDGDNFLANAKEFGVGTTAAQFSKDWIGYNDSKDYFLINKDQSGIYNFTLSGVSENAVLTIYELVDETTGKLKKVTSISVKAYNNGTTKDLMFDLTKIYYAEVTISNKKVLGTTYTLSSEIVKVANGEDDYNEDINTTQTISLTQSAINQWVGFNDPKDYRQVEISTSGVYQFNLSEITENTSLTIYELVDGNFKKLTSVTVKAGTAGQTTGLLLDAAKEYYVEVSAVNTKVLGTEYTLDLEAIKLVGSEENHGTSLNYKKAYATITEAYQTSDSDWVGFNDPSDYRKVEISNSGIYQFDLFNVTENTSLTIYEYVNGKFKKLTSITVKAGATNQTVGLLLDAAKEYYVEVSAVNTKVLGTNYTLDLTQIKPAGGEENYGTKLDVNEAYATITEADQASDRDWVGFNDPKDYRKVDIDNSGIYQFNLSGVTETTSLTIYELVDGNFKKLTSITVKAGATNQTAGLLLDAAKEYYVEVSAVNTKVLGTEYTLDLEAIKLVGGEENHGTSLNYKKAYDTITVAEYENDWVGFNDPSDYRKVEISNSGLYQFNLFGVTENTSLTIYEYVNGKFQKLTSITVKAGATNQTAGLLLDAAKEYYVEVSAVNTKVLGTEYTLDLELLQPAGGEENHGTKLDVNETYATITDADQISDSDWVGFNDTADYRLIDLNGVSGKFNFELNGVSANTILNIYEVVDGNVKKLTSVTAKDGKDAIITDLMLDGSSTSNKTYYAEVVVANKNAFGTTYDLDMELSEEVGGYASDDEGATELVASTKITDDWVGFNDISDYRELVGFTTGEGTLTLTANGNVTLTVYDKTTGKKLASISTTASKTTATTKAINFVEGTNYYIEVKSSNATAFGTQYDVSFDANLDTDFATERIDGILQNATNDIVGNVDTEDIFNFFSEGNVFDIQFSTDDINLELFDSNGRVVACEVNGNRFTSNVALASNEEYFLRVTAKESAKVNYSIALSTK